MEIYSHRIFTHESDRLIALAGLASKFQTSDDTFLYGLWKSDLAHGLSWRLSAENEETATNISLTSSNPSWSWASCPGKIITYSDIAYENNEIVMEWSITLLPVSENSLSVTFFEVLSADPVPLATNLVVLSTRPSLKLRGLVLRIVPAESCVAYNGNVLRANKSLILFRYAFSSKTRTCKQFIAHAFFDEAVTKGDNLYCLPLILLGSSKHQDAKRNTREPFEGHSINELASLQDSILSIGGEAVPGLTWCAGPLSCRRMKESDSFSCLLLKKVDVGVKFRRVGYLELCDRGRSFDGVSPTTLEII